MPDPIRLGRIDLTVEENINWVYVNETLPDDVQFAKPGAGTVDQLINYSMSNLLYVTQGVTKYVFPVAAVLVGVTGSVNTAPEGSDIILDVNRNNVSMFEPDKRPRILVGEEVGTEEGRFIDGLLAPGDFITVDIDQVGSITAGDYLNVVVRYRVLT